MSEVEISKQENRDINRSKINKQIEKKASLSLTVTEINLQFTVE